MPAHRKPTHRKKVLVAALGMALAGSGVAFAVQVEEEPVASAPTPLATTSPASPSASSTPEGHELEERDLRPSRSAAETREKLDMPRKRADRSKAKDKDKPESSPSPVLSSTPDPTPTPEPERKATVERQTTGQSTAPKPAPTQREGGILGDTNAARAEAGLATLDKSSCLTDLAQRHAERLAAAGSLHHQDLSAVMSVCGVSAAGENVAMNYTGPGAMVSQWMNSPGHRANILNGRFSLIGVGTAQARDGAWYAVQVFGDS